MYFLWLCFRFVIQYVDLLIRHARPIADIGSNDHGRARAAGSLLEFHRVALQGKGPVAERRLENEGASRFGVYRVSHDNIAAFGDDLIGILHDLESFIAAILVQPRTSGRLWPLGKQSCDARQDHSEFGELAGLRLNLD